MRNRTALITGGASGIGRAIGELMARRGANVVLADRQIELAREVAKGIVDRGGSARASELDVRDADAFAAVAREMRAKEGRIDYFFNNAGIGVGGEVRDYDDAAWDQVLDVNVRGVARGIQAVYPIMREQGSGHIVNTASMAGFLPMPHGVSYATSKHAVVGLSKSLRIEAAVHGVRVSALCPGAIQTPILLGGAYGRKVGRFLPDSKMKALWDRMRPMDVDQFAVEVLKDVEANEPYIIVPRWWKAVWLLERLAPKLSLAIWARTYAQQRRELEEHGLEPEGDTAAEIPIHAE
jgi:NAD(P)-dependent dehydrogenase (short-subunit alcohol dehydrogenase family)